MVKTDEERLAELHARLEALKVKATKIEGRKKAQERKIETRRKILAGAMVLHYQQTDDKARSWVERKMDGFLERDQDRALFGLPPRVKAEG
jgi:hypothetical protein